MNEELQKNLDEINKLPGLKKVKEEVKALIAFLENSKDREKQGLGDTLNITYHLIFSGNLATVVFPVPGFPEKIKYYLSFNFFRKSWNWKNYSCKITCKYLPRTWFNY